MRFRNQRAIGRVLIRRKSNRKPPADWENAKCGNPCFREYDGHRHGSMGPHLGSLEPGRGSNGYGPNGPHGPHGDGPDLGPRTLSKEEVQNDLAKLQYELEDLTNQLETIEQIKSKPRPR